MAEDTLSVEQPREPTRRPSGALGQAARSSGGLLSRLRHIRDIYKPGQGKHVRWGSAIGGGVIAAAGARFLYEWLRLPLGDSVVARTLIPVGLLVVLLWLIFWLVFQMKKVNWSSRKEVLGATKVVIFTVLALGFLLFIVDTLFMLMFSGMGVLKIPLWKSWFGIGQ
jgi:preprotein translocase SecE subunit